MTEKLTKAFEYVDSKGWKRSGVWSIVGRDAFLAGHASRDEEVRLLKSELHAFATTLKELIEAEWMVTHDWGGDRESILKQAQVLLAGHVNAISETEEEPTDLNP